MKEKKTFTQVEAEQIKGLIAKKLIRNQDRDLLVVKNKLEKI